MKPTFVLPWYGADVTGGAETEARKTVEGLQRLAGVEVEVLTTCVHDFHSDWSINARPEGLEWVDGIPVRRFPVRSRNTRAFDAVNLRLMHGLPLTGFRVAPPPQSRRRTSNKTYHKPNWLDYSQVLGFIT